ncbi:MAG: hypothetical protein KBC35_01525 [Candidatus Pacebacteria bacterium]|nr:hypothetical protein [Candidatus Paceibacterota bacterium]
MEKMHIEVTGGTVISLPVSAQSQGATLDEEYLAKRKAAGAKLPIIDVSIPEEDAKHGHEEA